MQKLDGSRAQRLQDRLRFVRAMNSYNLHRRVQRRHLADEFHRGIQIGRECEALFAQVPLDDFGKARLVKGAGVIVVSETGAEAERVDSLSRGADDFVTKPVDFDHLSTVIARHV